MKADRALRSWALIRLLAVPVALVALAVMSGRAVEMLVGYDQSHQIAKKGIEIWHNLLSRSDRLPWAMAGAIVAGGVLPALRPRWWALGALAVLLPMVLLAPHGTAVVYGTTALLLVNLLPAPWLAWGSGVLRWLSAVPGALLLLPVPSAHGLGRTVRGARGRALTIAATLVLGALGLMTDTYLLSGMYDLHLDEPERYPARQLDERIEVVDTADPGLHCEYHDIDLVDGRAVVLTELTGELLSYPPDGGEPATYQLPKHWGPKLGLTLDSETDPDRGLTWLLEGPDHVSAFRLVDGQWQRVARSAPLPRSMDHTYTLWLPEFDLLALIHMNSKSDPTRSFLHLVDLPQMESPRLTEPINPTGEPLPSPREVAWLPPLSKIVVSPDFGNALYLLDPFTGAGEPWIEVPTLNGKLTWVPEIERLLVALPQSRELWVIEPVSGEIERRVPVQLGTRTAALDVERGLLVTASVLSGQAQVRSWPDGELLDTYGRMMPMVRKVVLDTERGVAWLTTWEMLYRFPYVPQS